MTGALFLESPKIKIKIGEGGTCKIFLVHFNIKTLQKIKIGREGKRERERERERDELSLCAKKRERECSEKVCEEERDREG